jgi:hypothetical protein
MKIKPQSPMGEAMSFIINGRTFDTATASKVAISRDIARPRYNNHAEDSELRYERVLYRTPKGGLFVHRHETLKYVEGGRPITTDEADEIRSPEAAVEWIVDQDAVIIDATGLQLPGEA